MEYDLVVIGSSNAGIEAAEKAILLGARVALVTQGSAKYFEPDSKINYFRLKEATSFIDRVKYIPWLSTASNNNLAVNFKAINSRGNYDNLVIENSLTKLSVLGVDILDGKGEFCRLPKQAFVVGNRQLRSQKYLVTIKSYFKIHSIPGIEMVNCLTYDEVLQQNNLEKLKNNLVLVGTSPASLELAHLLGKIGKKVTLVVSKPRILPQEELAATMVIQAQLEADGVDIITDSQVTQIKKIANETWLEAGDKALVIDTIIFAEERELNLSGLNLEGVGVKYDTTGIKVNSKLQTTNKTIYACGDSVGTFSIAIIQQQINTVLKNILLLPWFKIDDSLSIRVVFTEPILTSIGMIERQAREYYGDKIYVVREYFKNLVQFQISEQTTGWCQFILNSQGVILGCTIIGDNAPELIATIAIMMHHKIKLSNNPLRALLRNEINTIVPSNSEILNKVALEFHQQKLQHNKQYNYWLKTWLKIKKKFS